MIARPGPFLLLLLLRCRCSCRLMPIFLSFLSFFLFSSLSPYKKIRSLLRWTHAHTHCCHIKEGEGHATMTHTDTHTHAPHSQSIIIGGGGGGDGGGYCERGRTSGAWEKRFRPDYNNNSRRRRQVSPTPPAPPPRSTCDVYIQCWIADWNEAGGWKQKHSNDDGQRGHQRERRRRRRRRRNLFWLLAGWTTISFQVSLFFIPQLHSCSRATKNGRGNW